MKTQTPLPPANNRFAFLASAEETHAGWRRKRNEDASISMPRFGLYCVADGMSGVWGGDVASNTAITALQNAFESEPAAAEAMHLDERTRFAERAINTASRMIRQKADELHFPGMGTTIVAILFDMVHPSRAMCLHAGDSRAYRFREGTLSLLTRDHTVATAAGIEDESQLPSIFRGVVTRAVGVEDSVQIDRTPVDVRPDDLFLLCSDGLSKMIPDTRIGQVCGELKSEHLDTLAHALVLAALDAGGEDNVTITVVRVASSLPNEPVFNLPDAPVTGTTPLPAMGAGQKTATPTSATPTPASLDTGDLIGSTPPSFVRNNSFDGKGNMQNTPDASKSAFSRRFLMLAGLFALVTAVGIAIFLGWLMGRATLPTLFMQHQTTPPSSRPVSDREPTDSGKKPIPIESTATNTAVLPPPIPDTQSKPTSSAPETASNSTVFQSETSTPNTVQTPDAIKTPAPVATTQQPMPSAPETNVAQTQIMEPVTLPSTASSNELIAIAPAATPAPAPAPAIERPLLLDTLFESGQWGDSTGHLAARLPTNDWNVFSSSISNWVSLWTWARLASLTSLNTNYYACEESARILLQNVYSSQTLPSPGRWPIRPSERADAFCRARYHMQRAACDALIKSTDEHFCRRGSEASQRALLFRDFFRMTFQKDTESVLETLNDLARATDDLDRIRARARVLQASNAPLFSQGADPELRAVIDDLNARTDRIVEMLYRTAHVLPQAMTARRAPNAPPTPLETSILASQSRLITSRVPFGADVRAWRNSGITTDLDKLMNAVHSLLDAH